MLNGATTTAPPPFACRARTRPRAASKIVSRPPTPIPIWRSPRRWPASANEDEIDLPRGLLEAVDLFEADDELRAMLGSSFVATYTAIKRAEFETFMEVISPWEREFLLLNV